MDIFFASLLLVVLILVVRLRKLTVKINEITESLAAEREKVSDQERRVQFQKEKVLASEIAIQNIISKFEKLEIKHVALSTSHEALLTQHNYVCLEKEELSRTLETTKAALDELSKPSATTPTEIHVPYNHSEIFIKYEALSSEHQIVQSAFQGLKNELACETASLATLKKTHQNLFNEHQALLQKYQGLEENCRMLTEKCKSLNETNASLSSYRSLNQVALDEVTRNLQAITLKYDNEANSNEELRCKNKDLLKENNTLSYKLESVSRELSEQTQAAVKISELQNAREVQTVAWEQERTAYIEESARFQRDMAAQLSRQAQLKSQFSDLSAKFENTSMRYQEALQKIEDSSSKYESSVSQHREALMLQRNIYSELLSERDGLFATAEAQRHMLVALQTDRDSLQIQLQSLYTRLEEASHAHCQLRAAHDSLEVSSVSRVQALERLQAERDELSGLLQRQKDSEDQLLAQSAEAAAVGLSLEQQLRESRTERDAALQEVSELTARLASLGEMCSHRLTAFNVLQHQLYERDSDIAALRADINNHLEVADRERAAAVTRLEASDRVSQELSLQLTAAKEQLGALEICIKEARVLKTSQDAELAATYERLVHVREQFDSAVRELAAARLEHENGQQMLHTAQASMAEFLLQRDMVETAKTEALHRNIELEQSLARQAEAQMALQKQADSAALAHLEASSRSSHAIAKLKAKLLAKQNEVEGLKTTLTALTELHDQVSLENREIYKNFELKKVAHEQLEIQHRVLASELAEQRKARDLLEVQGAAELKREKDVNTDEYSMKAAKQHKTLAARAEKRADALVAVATSRRGSVSDLVPPPLGKAKNPTSNPTSRRNSQCELSASELQLREALRMADLKAELLQTRAIEAEQHLDAYLTEAKQLENGFAAQVQKQQAVLEQERKHWEEALQSERDKLAAAQQGAAKLALQLKAARAAEQTLLARVAATEAREQEMTAGQADPGVENLRMPDFNSNEPPCVVVKMGLVSPSPIASTHTPLSLRR